MVFEVLAAASIKITLLWHFKRWVYVAKMEADGDVETLVTACQTTRHAQYLNCTLI
jgi:hypothetical protein